MIDAIEAVSFGMEVSVQFSDSSTAQWAGENLHLLGNHSGTEFLFSRIR